MKRSRDVTEDFFLPNSKIQKNTAYNLIHTEYDDFMDFNMITREYDPEDFYYDEPTIDGNPRIPWFNFLID